jgi:adenylylsulfate kinase
MKQTARRRAIAKAVTWRIISTTFTGILAYLFFGNWSACSLLMLWDFLLKFALYYHHERLWQRIPWGQK